MIPATIARLEFEKRQVDPSTPDGLYTSVLLRTGNKKLAEKTRTEFLRQIALAQQLGRK